MNFLSSFRPLNINKRGRKAIESFKLMPFIDSSCRREPDLESKYPSISAICHAGKFAPRLDQNDIVVFITVKGKYAPINFRHWRLVAVLKVIERFESHAEAAMWYYSKGLDIPSNCIAKENKPFPLEMTAGPIPFSKSWKSRNSIQIINMWDDFYQKRTTKYGVFLVCEPEYIELNEPLVLTEEQLRKIFGKIPGTRTPPEISTQQLNKLREIIARKNED